MFNGDVLTQVDLGAVLRLHRERKAKATIVLTPVDNPRAYGLVETDAQRQRQPLPRKARRRRDHLQHDQRRHLRARARDLRSHSEGHRLVDRAQLLPVADRARRDLRRLRPQRLLDRHRHAGEVHAGPSRHHGRPLLGAAVRRHAAGGVGLAGRAGRGGRRTARPVLHRRRRGRQGRARGSCPTRCIGRQTHVDEGRAHRRRDHLAERLDRPRSRASGARSSAATATSAATPSSTARRCSATRRSSPTTASYDHHQHVHLQGLRRPRPLSRPRSTRRRRG